MNDLPTPLSRIELYLGAAAGMTGVTMPDEPMSRLEQYLAFIAGDTSVELPTPASLCEQWLAYVAGIAPSETLKLEGAFHIGAQKVDVRFFAAAAGMPGVLAPEPQNRTEEYWVKLAEVLPVHGTLKYETGTSITLTDVAWWRMRLERINGDTTQQTYTGKNLLSITGETSSGVTGTMNPDGTFTISGKATVTDGVRLGINTDVTLPAGTYTFTIGAARSSVTNLILSDDKTNTSLRIAAGQTSATATTAYTVTKLALFIAVTNGVTYNETFSLQLVSGSTPDYDFEPYVGGVPAPNPDYPQAINVVSGAQTVTVASAQKLTKEGMATSSSDDDFWNLLQRITHKPLGNGWARFTTTSTNNYGNFFLRRAAVDEFSLNSTHTIIVEIDNVSKKEGYIDFASPANADDPYSSFEMIYGTSATNTVARLDLASGQTLLAFKVVTKSGFSRDRSFRAYTRPNVLEGTSFDLRVTFLNGDHTSDWQNYCGNNWQPYQKTDYALDLGSIELCKISTYQDYIYKSGNDWFVHKGTRGIVLDGREKNGWSKLNNVYRSNGVASDVASAAAVGIALCDKFIYWPNLGGISTSLPNYSFGWAQDRSNIDFRYDAIADADAWRAWLTANPIKLYYALRTPTDTKITNSALIAQLNALDRAILPKPVAYITASGDLPGELKISYYGEDE